jgi:hypothetical protein
VPKDACVPGVTGLGTCGCWGFSGDSLIPSRIAAQGDALECGGPERKGLPAVETDKSRSTQLHQVHEPQRENQANYEDHA